MNWRSIGEWFRWLTPIALGILIQRGIREEDMQKERAKEIQTSIKEVSMSAKSYTDGRVDQLASSLNKVADSVQDVAKSVAITNKDTDKEIVQMKIKLAEIEGKNRGRYYDTGPSRSR